MSISQLSKQILRLRKERKMTQGSVASRVGVSTTAISQFENGANRPSLETLTKLSEVLGEDLRELVPDIDGSRFHLRKIILMFRLLLIVSTID